MEGSGLGEPVRKVLNPVISPLSEHRRGLIMLCNSDFSERLGGWESVIWVLSVEGHALDIEPSTISWFSVEGHALDIEPSTISWFSVEGPCSGYRTIHDFTVQRGRSLLWITNHPRYRGPAWKVLLGISNHPRYHGSAWKVTALDIEPSTISRFSVESHRSEYRTIHDFMVQRGRSLNRI